MSSSPKAGDKRGKVDDQPTTAQPSSPKKAAAAAAAGVDNAGYTMNTNEALVKEYETTALSKIPGLPPHALQGLSTKIGDKMLAHFKLHTIEALSKWRFFLMARAIVTLAETEQDGRRDPVSMQNINGALDKEWEKKTLKEIVDAPVHALQGLADWADGDLKALHIHTVKDLATNKFFRWAEAFTVLAPLSRDDFSSR